MGLFTDEKWDLVEGLKLTQLKQIVKEKKLDVGTFLFKNTPNKENYMNAVYNSNKVSKTYLKKIAKGDVAASTKSNIPGKKMPVSTVASAIKNDFHIHKAHDSEKEFERDFVMWAKGKFGNANVVTQYAVGRTRIDVVIGGVGVELKYPKTPKPLQTLRGQIDVYKQHFGNNIMVLLFSAKCDPSQIALFKSDMKKKKVTVIEKK